MQLIAEAYDIMRNVAGMGNNEISKVFQVWNNGPLESYLIEITAAILSKKDDITNKDHVVDYVSNYIKSCLCLCISFSS